MGVSDLPLSPTANLYCEQRTVCQSTCLVAERHIAEMQRRPERRRSATLKNLFDLLGMSQINSPFSLTSANLFNMLTLGTFTCVKARRALSIPLRPNLTPISSIMTPLQGYILSSLIRTMKALIPSFLPLTIVQAKTTAQLAWQAPFVIQNFCDLTVGL